MATGSRLRYCGRTYFTEVKHAPKLAYATLRFNASRFVIENTAGRNIRLDALAPLLASFYRDRAHEKLLARVEYATGNASQSCVCGQLTASLAPSAQV